jgi:hypothetical protein
MPASASHKRGTPTPARPGTGPAVVSGTLRRSLTHSPVVSYGAGWETKVGTGAGVSPPYGRSPASVYGLALETGLRNGGDLPLPGARLPVRDHDRRPAAVHERLPGRLAPRLTTALPTQNMRGGAHDRGSRSIRPPARGDRPVRQWHDASRCKSGETFTQRMGGLSGMLTKVGKATTVVGLGFVAYGVKAAGDFQQKMNLLVTACGESTSKLKQVSDGVLSLARETGTSTNELADGMYQVEKAGYRGADGLKVLKAAAQGAREEGASLKDVTNAMTSVMASYHLKASDSVNVMNAIKTAAGEGKVTMEEFSGALSTVIPIASANKISFAEVGGAIATLSQHGTSAREATQELASTIRSLAAPNNVAVQEMQRLGLSSTDVSTKLGQRGLTGTLDLLSQTVLSKMGPSGTVLLDSFNKTKQASADLRTMLQSMPAPVQKLATDLQTGAISTGAFTKAIKALARRPERDGRPVQDPAAEDRPDSTPS